MHVIFLREIKVCLLRDQAIRGDFTEKPLLLLEQRNARKIALQFTAQKPTASHICTCKNEKH